MASLVALMSKRFVLSEICIVIVEQFPYHAARRQLNLMDTVTNSRLNKSSINGEVSEWLKEHAWKVCIRQRIEGSNPSLTAILKRELQQCGFFCV